MINAKDLNRHDQILLLKDRNRPGETLILQFGEFSISAFVIARFGIQIFKVRPTRFKGVFSDKHQDFVTNLRQK